MCCVGVNCEGCKPKQLRKRVMQNKMFHKNVICVYQNIVGVTALGCGHALLQKRTFDVCIVDEATQAVQASLIAALHSSKVFILVGDPQQLPPLIKNKKAK